MSQPLLVIRVPSSHLYPGLRLRATRGREAGVWLSSAEQEADVLLLFADGSQAAARLEMGQAGGPILQVTAYKTARGTLIPARTWRVRSIDESSEDFELRLGGRFLPVRP